MKVGDICSPQVLTVGMTDALATCARQMKTRNVGCAVVVDREQGFPRPIGVITDRDVLRGQFERNADLFCLNTEDVMTRDPLVLQEDCDIADALERMSRRAVRRAPVVDAGGELVGIVTFDDLLPVVAGEMSAIASLISGQIERRRHRG